MSFHEVRFPAPLSMGSSGGPERRTEIVSLRNGAEERNTPWRHSRRHYDAGLGMRSLDDLAEVVAFFEARRGQLFGFRWKDWSDFKSCPPSARPGPMDQAIGTGDGSRRTFPLSKHYGRGADRYERPIRKPVAGTVSVAVAGVIRDQADYVLDTTSGTVTLVDAPVEGALVTAGFEFDVPVRFDVDRVAVSVAGFAAGEIPSVPVIEIRV
ncbi:TIGR02217 family protein [Amaricoccus sp. W119]|uniref:phage distal tail protein, Rcc01695 family n=1 Tax=Amaricoccus sp. W119 TaxID=3391833 RepID=UPI0039A76E56